jgi:hypothetical protein
MRRNPFCGKTRPRAPSLEEAIWSNLSGEDGVFAASIRRTGQLPRDEARAVIPLLAGILAWGGLYLRDSRIRQLVPFRRSA